MKGGNSTLARILPNNAKFAELFGGRERLTDAGEVAELNSQSPLPLMYWTPTPEDATTPHNW